MAGYDKKIYIYNSLTRKKDLFKPLNPPLVNMYTCGVTVYDDCHIGHARSLYIFEVMRRYLEYRGFKVNFARNITDIDDKIINRANELKVDWKELVEKYIASYRDDLKSLGVRLGLVDKDGEEPRATKSIADIKRYIALLIDKGYAYVTQSGVYFSVRKFKDYGKLSGQGIDEMRTGVRKDSDETKQDPLDFALWKASKPGEPSWESSWGAGRPGWHIECSVMSTKYLKTDTLDVHAGGRDLIFPHHENEIAQSEAASGKPFAKYWIHHGLLTINGQKMSKSLGNFVTVRDFIAKYKNADFLKFFFLSAHYSSPVDYTEAKIEEAKKAYERIGIMLNRANEILNKMSQEEKKQLDDEIRRENHYGFLISQFMDFLDDDFNMPRALAVLNELITETNNTITKYPQILHNREAIKQLYASCYVALPDILSVFGLKIDYNNPLGLCLDEDVDALVIQRIEAKKIKDFVKADKIRKDLEEQGIILEDNKDGTTIWRRKL